MLYTPHILSVKRLQVIRDEYNRPKETKEAWVKLGKCRCDDNSTQLFQTEEGKAYRPQYHVVCPKNVSAKPGDEVRITDGNSIRGEGKVYNVKRLNFLDFAELWI